MSWPSLPWFLSFLKPGLYLRPAREFGLESLNSEHPSNVCLEAAFLGQLLPPLSSCSLFLQVDFFHSLCLCSFHLQFFELDVYNSDGSPLTTDQLFIQLEKIWNTSLQTNKEPIGILTTNHRNSWAKAYNNLLKGLCSPQRASANTHHRCLNTSFTAVLCSVLSFGKLLKLGLGR